MIGRSVKLALAVAIVALVGVAIFRPATLFGVNGKALANSLGGDIRQAEAKCVDDGSGRWRCSLSGGTVNGVEYVLRTHRFGCWSGTRVTQPRSAAPVDSSISGCIGFMDEFGN